MFNYVGWRRRCTSIEVCKSASINRPIYGSIYLMEQNIFDSVDNFLHNDLKIKDELKKRRDFAFKQGANEDAIYILDKLSAEYEESYLQGIL